MANNLSKEEIWEKLEEKRFSQLKQAAVNLQSEMIFNNRCPKCTLVPPCKHYQTAEQILEGVPQLIQQPSFKQHLSPKRREILFKAIKEQQKVNMHNTQVEFSKSLIIPEDSQIQGFSQNEISQMRIEMEDQMMDLNTSVIGNKDEHLKSSSQPSSKTTYLSNRSQRNSHMNNTMVAPMGFRGQSEHQTIGKNLHYSKLSQYGANILNGTQNLAQQRHYLKKRQGNGGSPVPESSRFNESKISDESMTRGVKQRDRTTVRIRTKNNEYLYGEGSFIHPLNSTKNDVVHNRSYFDTSQQSMQEREKMQAMIAKYREEKIQRQIEIIEQEKVKIEMERLQQKEEDQKRRKHNELLKQRLSQFQQIKYQEQMEKQKEEEDEYRRKMQRERMRRQYYEQQRKNIVDYRQQKQRTDELLLIPQNHQKNVYYNQFPSPNNQMQDKKFKFQSNEQPMSSGGLISNAGKQFISSGHGEVEITKVKSYRNQYQQNQDEEEGYDQYYNEDGEDKPKPKSKEQQNDNSSNHTGQSHRQAKLDSLDLINKNS